MGDSWRLFVVLNSYAIALFFSCPFMSHLACICVRRGWVTRWGLFLVRGVHLFSGSELGRSSYHLFSHTLSMKRGETAICWVKPARSKHRRSSDDITIIESSTETLRRPYVVLECC